MAEVVFNYKTIDINIQCQLDDKMEVIIDRFLINALKNKDNNNFYYLYNGSNINNELTFNEQANELDKSRRQMNIIVYENIDPINEIISIISDNIICPDCKESIFIDFNNFKINLFGCKNKHKIYNILLDKYEETQKINFSTIVCEICNQNNRNDTYNNEFYRCNACNKNMCTLCKSVHDESHTIISYDDKNYLCKSHNKTFNSYCKNCCENLCLLCKDKHKVKNKDNNKDRNKYKNKDKYKDKIKDLN